MKNVLFLLFAIPVYLVGQTTHTVNVWDVRPDSICPGDSITVLYKVSNPNAQPDQTTTFLHVGSFTVWSGNWSVLASKPKEKWPSLPDSVWVITVITPTNLPVGPNIVKFTSNPGFVGMTGTVTVKNCSCTISTSFTSTSSDLSTTLTAITVGSNSTTVYKWDFGEGSGWQTGASVQTYTFGSVGSYTVSLNVSNPTCQYTYSTVVSVSITPTSTTGISEYELNQIKPVYFDLYGNKTEKKAGVILIEQRGTIFRKILIQ